MLLYQGMEEALIQLLGVHWRIILLVMILWVLPWKGVALWMSARRGHMIWFIIFLLVNSVAILPIFYIFFIGRKIEIEEEEVLEN